MLSNEQIRYAGRPILEYRPLPAPKEFHRSQAKYRWCFGGNRSGKSESNIGYDLCSFALGLHPFRKTRKNAVIWAAANTWSLVGKLLWTEKIKRYMPARQIQSIVWHNKQDEIPKELRLANGNRIEFKAYEQGRKVFEGRAIDAFYGDEQCKSDSEGIWIEIQARLLDLRGFSAQSMTPIIYQPWLEGRIKNLPATDEVFYANLNDNRQSRGGHVHDEEIDNLIAQWPEEVQETRIKGHFGAFLGTVYRTFNRQVHVIDPFEIPKDWDRYRAIDWGFNNPFVCLWVARDKDKHWYVYAEHYKARELLAYHAERIKQVSGKERYSVTWADHDAQDRHEFAKLRIKTTPAKKDVRLGIEAVQATLKMQGDGKPRLFIFSTCTNTIREMTGYRWPDGTENRDPADKPLEINDHTLDALRYTIYGVEGAFYFSDCDLS